MDALGKSLSAREARIALGYHLMQHLLGNLALE